MWRIYGNRGAGARLRALYETRKGAYAAPLSSSVLVVSVPFILSHR